MASAGISITAYPVATFVVNVLGSFLIGIALALGQARLGPTLTHFIIPGFLGGFTTYSAFAGETVLLFEKGLHLLALTHVAATTVACLVATALGIWLSRYLV
jgi:CrcB protein